MSLSSRTENRVAKSVPITSFEYVDVFFPAENEDVLIQHALQTDFPDEVQWEVVSINNGGVVYRDGSTERRKWGEGYVILRCTAAGTTARLRLVVTSAEDRPTPVRTTGVPTLPAGGGGGATISDAAYDGTWNGNTTDGASKNSLYDKFEEVVSSIASSVAAAISDTAYDATTWNGVTTVAPSKNAVRDKFEALAATIPTVSDAAYGAGWNGDTTAAPSKNAVYDKIEAIIGSGSPVEQSTSSTGTQNNFSLSGHFTILRSTGAAPEFTGFTISGSAPSGGDRVLLVNTGTTLWVRHENASSTAANRITCQSTNGHVVGSGGALLLEYESASSRWRVVFSSPGAPISVTYASGNFTGNGSMTWTVDSGDQTTYAYVQNGKMLTVFFEIDSTSVGGVLNSSLQLAVPGGFTSTRTLRLVCYANDNGTDVDAFVIADTSGTVLRIRKSAGNYSSSTNNTSVRGQLTFEVN